MSDFEAALKKLHEKAGREHLAECPAFPIQEWHHGRKLGTCACGKAEERLLLSEVDRLKAEVESLKSRPERKHRCAKAIGRMAVAKKKAEAEVERLQREWPKVLHAELGSAEGVYKKLEAELAAEREELRQQREIARKWRRAASESAAAFTARRERAEGLEKALRRYGRHDGQVAGGETCDALSDEIRNADDARCSCGLIEVLRPAAPDPTPLCVCGHRLESHILQAGCVGGGQKDCECSAYRAPDPTPSEEFGDPWGGGPVAGSEQPDLPLGHEFAPCRRLHGRRNTHNCADYEHCDECGEFASAHRRREP